MPKKPDKGGVPAMGNGLRTRSTLDRELECVIDTKSTKFFSFNFDGENLILNSIKNICIGVGVWMRA